jgi:DNA mismatch endonuclease, patch repair protein
MPDIVDSATRSRMMSGIRGRDTRPELKVRRFLHRAGFRYRLHAYLLPGKPDLVLPRYHAVVFVHGCFWHRHRGCRFAYLPKSREAFWRAKLEGNAVRDARVAESLRRSGWRVFVVWECEINAASLTTLAAALRPDLDP